MDVYDKIFLQIEPLSPKYQTWCEERVNESDIEYIKKTDNKLVFFSRIDAEEMLEETFKQETETRELKSLLKECRDTMRHAKVFIKSREKMYRDGVILYNELLTRLGKVT